MLLAISGNRVNCQLIHYRFKTRNPKCILHVGLHKNAAVVLIVGDLMNSPVASNILKTEVPESTAVEYELPEYPIQMTEERQKQERRVSVYVSFSTNMYFSYVSLSLTSRTSLALFYRSVIVCESRVFTFTKKKIFFSCPGIFHVVGLLYPVLHGTDTSLLCFTDMSVLTVLKQLTLIL